jgi:sigma-B regulation protein RsbU (phosphoserine phosphatase)
MLAEAWAARLEPIRAALLTTWPGRLAVAGGVAKLVAWLVRLALGRAPLPIEGIDTLGSVALIVGVAYFVYRLILRAKRRLLWRVRRKLILSYVFIGVVPVLLVVVFFCLSGLFLFLNVSSYLVLNALRDWTEEARFLAQATVDEIEGAGGPLAGGSILERRARAFGSRYPGASLALVPTAPEPCGARGKEVPPGAAAPAPPSAGPPTPEAKPGRARRAFPAVAMGEWSHVEAPDTLPSWLPCSGWGGMLGYTVTHDGAAAEGEESIALRGVALAAGDHPAYAVLVDVPLNDQQRERLREETSVKPGDITLMEHEGDRGTADASRRSESSSLAPTRDPNAGGLKYRFPWVAVLETTDWATGITGTTEGQHTPDFVAAVNVGVSIADMYERLSASEGRIGDGLRLSNLLLAGLLVVAALFLIIEVIALVMGLMLGKSITGSVHELFAGTEHVRTGDFSHRIRVRTQDQLGDLADSFNSMTASIEDLLREQAEKKRLEEELRIAREIQMSLLPRGPLEVPGLSVTALCLPAREVGGDYYDFLPLDDHRLGVLIADVSGKGTSAALYMAELKGLMLSLSRMHASPKLLLIDANRIISENLDSRSFITMTYAIIDTRAGTMTYARAGHTPLIYRPERNGLPEVQILAPDGLVLGLQLDGGVLFEQLLQEATLPLEQGDLLLFFTDGISEAMNSDSDCFGEARLGQLVAEHGDLPPEELRERILREIESFVAGAPQHDDMTLILIKVESRVAVGLAGRELSIAV